MFDDDDEPLMPSAVMKYGTKLFGLILLTEAVISGLWSILFLIAFIKGLEPFPDNALPIAIIRLALTQISLLVGLRFLSMSFKRTAD